ncbi:MAG: hypothetical protein JW742_04110 [Candidatus Aminicenantes bacterium]|nr:hypothetical protein [Candidatus Aminicenantes bacterium]
MGKKIFLAGFTVVTLLSASALIGSGLAPAQARNARSTSRAAAARDRAAIWTAIGPEGGQVAGLARNPKAPNELYAALSGYPGQVFRSVNNGASWTLRGVVMDLINDVAIDPLDSRKIYVLGGRGFFKSADRGATFSEVRFPAGFQAGNGRIAVNPAHPEIQIVAGEYYKSAAGETLMAVAGTADGGATWTLQTFEPASASGRAYDVAISPKNPDLAFVCGYFQMTGGVATPCVFVSRNGGRTWKNTTTAGAFQPENGGICYGLAVDARDANRAYVAHGRGVALTSDGGANWKASAVHSAFVSVAVDGLNSGILYALISGLAQSPVGGCYKSSDGGKNWKHLEGLFYGWGGRLLARGPRVHAATSAGVFRSANGGRSWKASHAGMKATDVPAFAVAPSAPSTIYAGPYSYAFFKTTDGGRTWTQKQLPGSSDQFLSVVVHPANAETVYVLAGSGSPSHVYKSTDGGASFTSVFTHNGRNLALSPGNPKIVVVAGQAEGMASDPPVRGIHISRNGGATWTSIKIRDDAYSAAEAAALDPKNGNIIYVVGASAAGSPVCYKSANGGASWTLLAVPTQQTPLRVVIDPVDSKIVYIGSWDGLYRSGDGGATWAETGDFFDVRTLVINKRNPQEVFVGYPGGVYRSTDRGLTWSSFIDDLVTYQTQWLDIDAKNRVLYAGTVCGGIRRRKI